MAQNRAKFEAIIERGKGPSETNRLCGEIVVESRQLRAEVGEWYYHELVRPAVAKSWFGIVLSGKSRVRYQ